jgi:hypothetical protein
MTLLDSTFVAPGSFVVIPPRTTAEPIAHNVAGVALIHSAAAGVAAAEAALKALRQNKASGRRIAWINSTELSRTSPADLRGWGRKTVEQGKAEMTVFSGTGARELALAARDAGLPIGRVIVCTDDAVARNLLCDSIKRGDAVLALGISSDSAARLTDRIECRFERQLTAN